MVLQSVLKECFQLKKKKAKRVCSELHPFGAECSAPWVRCTLLSAGGVPGSHIPSSCSFLWPSGRLLLTHWDTKQNDVMLLSCVYYITLKSIIFFFFFLNMLNDEQQSTVFVKLKGHSSGGCCSGQFYLECLVLYDSGSSHKHTFPERSLVSSHTLSRHD